VPLPERHHAELDRYLLDGERVVTAVHQHWGKVAEPVGSAIVGLVVALWVDTKVDPSFGWFSTLVWWLWFALVLRMAYRLAEWRHDWFVATDKRLLLFYGFITRKVSMMPLMKVTDMSFERSVPGRLLGYGRFVMESAGQDQALREVNWVPQPDHNYRAICAEIFGVADRDSVDPDDADSTWRHDDRWDDRDFDHPHGGGEAPRPPRGIPDPYAGWDDARFGGQNGPGDDGSVYRSPDLRARDRSADTGPIPIRPRRDVGDD
jgi:hypothetical protein